MTEDRDSAARRDAALQKTLLRREALRARRRQPNQDETSRQVIAALIQSPEYQQAHSVLWYLDCRSEVRTRDTIFKALSGPKRIVIPYCTIDDHGERCLGLWLLESPDELTLGEWGILAPPRAKWSDPAKRILAAELDFVVTPGVAFGRDGARLGNGQGYYDRLLQNVRADCLLAGLCFESQLTDNIIMAPYDVYMDKVVTESAVYEGRGRS